MAGRVPVQISLTFISAFQKKGAALRCLYYLRAGLESLLSCSFAGCHVPDSELSHFLQLLVPPVVLTW